MIGRLSILDYGEHFSQLHTPFRYELLVTSVTGFGTGIPCATIEAVHDLVRRIVGWVRNPDEMAMNAA